MSLTYHLSDKNSELAQFLETTFPRRESVFASYRQDSPDLQVPPRQGANPGTVGTAFDLLLRFELVARPSLALAKAGATLAGERFVTLVDQLVDRLGCTGKETGTGIGEVAITEPRPQEDAELVLRGCYIAALFTEVFRSRVVWPGSLLASVGRRTNLDELMAMVPSDALLDLLALLDLARGVLVPAVKARGNPLWLGPTFDGSRWISADADMIAGGLLLDVKTGAGSRRKDGSHYNGLDRETLYQLLGYLLFDFSDRYRIVDVGLYAARYGHLIIWPVPELLGELVDAPVTLETLRRRCQQVVENSPARAGVITKSRLVPLDLDSSDERDVMIVPREQSMGSIHPHLDLLDEEESTDSIDPEVETVRHQGVCSCGARYQFTTNILRGFADFVEAHCPECGASLGEFREDVAASIVVELLEPPHR